MSQLLLVTCIILIAISVSCALYVARTIRYEVAYITPVAKYLSELSPMPGETEEEYKERMR